MHRPDESDISNDALVNRVGAMHFPHHVMEKDDRICVGAMHFLYHAMKKDNRIYVGAMHFPYHAMKKDNRVYSRNASPLQIQYFK